MKSSSKGLTKLQKPEKIYLNNSNLLYIFEAKIKLNQAIDGQKRFRGRIEGVENGEALLAVCLGGQKDGKQGGQKGKNKNRKKGSRKDRQKDCRKEEHILGFAPAMIEEAKLIMNDELIREAMAGRAAQPATSGVDELKD